MLLVANKLPRPLNHHHIIMINDALVIHYDMYSTYRKRYSVFTTYFIQLNKMSCVTQYRHWLQLQISQHF